MSPPLLSRPPAPERVPDDVLMQRCGRGETDALEELLRRHQAAAFRYCWRVFRNHHTAEDLTQDFFVKLFRNAVRYEPQGHFTTYFYRVLANLCYDALRKRKRRRKVESVQIDPLACEGTELEPMMQGGDPQAPLLIAESKDAVHAALAALPVEVRKALVDDHFLGFCACVVSTEGAPSRDRQPQCREVASADVDRRNQWSGFPGTKGMLGQVEATARCTAQR